MVNKIDDSLVLRMHIDGKSQRDIAEEIGCSKTGVQKRLAKMLRLSDQPSNQRETIITEAGSSSDKNIPNYYTNQRYMRRLITGEIFVWTEFIANKENLEEVRWDGKKFVVVPSCKL